MGKANNTQLSKDEIYNKAIKNILNWINKQGKGLCGGMSVRLGKYKGFSNRLHVRLCIDFDTGIHFIERWGAVYFMAHHSRTEFDREAYEKWESERFYLNSHQDLSYYEANDPDMVMIINKLVTYWDLFKLDIERGVRQIQEKEVYALRRAKLLAEDVV